MLSAVVHNITMNLIRQHQYSVFPADFPGFSKLFLCKAAPLRVLGIAEHPYPAVTDLFLEIRPVEFIPAIPKLHGTVHGLSVIFLDHLKKRIVNRRIDENLVPRLRKGLHRRRHSAVDARRHGNPLRLCLEAMPPQLPGSRRLKTGRGRTHIAVNAVIHAGPQGLIYLIGRRKIRVRHPKRKQHVTAASDIFLAPFRAVVPDAGNGGVKIIYFSAHT